jgi:beta-xylosidase
MKISFIVYCAVVSAISLCSGFAFGSISDFSIADTLKENGYNNPVIPGDFADPSVIRVDDIYYATGTSSEWGPHFPVFKSKDLVNWTQIGYVFDTKPSWTASSFWAPELFYHNKKFYLYYVARKANDGTSCIGVASAVDPENGFTDHGILLEHGKEAIDPFVFDDGNQLYITWKAYGLDQRPIELLGSRLSDDGLKVEGQPFSLLKDDARKGMEGQALIKKDNYYFLFYSIGACCGRSCSYLVNVARATSVTGPYINMENNPLLGDNEEWKCPGHGTLVETSDHRQFYMFHAYSKRDHVYTGRQGLLDEIVWEDNWPSCKNGKSPSVSAATNGTDQRTSEMIRDEFSTSLLGDAWQWDFRNSAPKINLKNGTLCLSGAVEKTNHTGIALTVRPFKGNYEIETQITNRNTSLKGLTVYGDVGEAVGIGVSDNKVQVWEVKKKIKSILYESLLKSDRPVDLKITSVDGFKMTFYWRQYDVQWNSVNLSASSYYDASFLPAWDRSPRPGIHYQGSSKEDGCFSFFEIRYPR